ncbi:MAG: PQQ-binding-like beta-propeller repeat protein, partial [bacterium]
MKRGFVVASITAVLISWTTVSHLQASGVWPMFQNNAQRTGKGAAGGPLVPAIKWSYDIGSEDLYSSPALDQNDTVFVSSAAGLLYSIDSSGAFLWSYESFFL